ncbi:MAG TPA: hypothetical protein VLV48_02665 [Thermoanaerobaculia bacterium]|nr:hypothetical protein [Thermoanaerobaculia bacterium]
MKQQGCEREMELIGALRRGELPADLRDHARGCADCSDAAKVSVWMNALASTAARQSPPPDPMVLYLKAQIMATLPGDQRALQPLHLLQRVAFALVGLGWAVLLTWKWDAIRNLSLDRALAGAIGGAAVSPSLIALIFALGCATILVTVHTALAE